MVRPDAVDEDTSGERVTAVSDGAGQLESPAAVVKGATVLAGQDPEEAARNRLAGIVRAAAQEDARLNRSGDIDQHHRPRRRARPSGAPLLNVLAQLLQLGLR